MIEVTKKKKISPAMWVMECPKCGKVLAGAPERYLLPDIEICRCDEVKMDMIRERERIGKRIAQLRKERGITQQELAERTGMQQGNIARIEAGKYSARFDTLQTIAEAMGLTVDFVAGCH